MNKIADDIEEVLDGKRKLSNLPEIMQSTVNILKKEIIKINKLYNKYVPDDNSFAHALNGGTKVILKNLLRF